MENFVHVRLVNVGILPRIQPVGVGCNCMVSI